MITNDFLKTLEESITAPQEMSIFRVLKASYNEAADNLHWPPHGANTDKLKQWLWECEVALLAFSNRNRWK